MSVAAVYACIYMYSTRTRIRIRTHLESPEPLKGTGLSSDLGFGTCFQLDMGSVQQTPGPGAGRLSSSSGAPMDAFLQALRPHLKIIDGFIIGYIPDIVPYSS